MNAANTSNPKPPTILRSMLTFSIRSSCGGRRTVILCAEREGCAFRIRTGSLRPYRPPRRFRRRAAEAQAPRGPLWSGRPPGRSRLVSLWRSRFQKARQRKSDTAKKCGHAADRSVLNRATSDEWSLLRPLLPLETHSRRPAGQQSTACDTSRSCRKTRSMES